jgi:hypothetical protein
MPFQHCPRWIDGDVADATKFTTGGARWPAAGDGMGHYRQGWGATRKVKNWEEDLPGVSGFVLEHGLDVMQFELAFVLACWCMPLVAFGCGGHHASSSFLELLSYKQWSACFVTPMFWLLRPRLGLGQGVPWW